MESYRNIIVLNNKATSFLAQGKISDTNLMFRQALQNLKRFPKGEEKNQQLQFSKRVRQDVVPSSSEESDGVMICSVTLSKEFYDQEAAESTGSAMGVLSVFNHAFSIESTSWSCDSTRRQLAFCRKIRNRMSAVVFYNMGLLRHCRGIQNGKSQDLRDAMALYEWSYKILIQLIRQKPGCAVADTLLLLALFNNMGHIHSTEFETAATKRCIANMKKVVMCREFDLLKEDDAIFFYQNVLTAPANPILTAPAA